MYLCILHIKLQHFTANLKMSITAGVFFHVALRVLTQQVSDETTRVTGQMLHMFLSQMVLHHFTQNMILLLGLL